MAYRQVPAVTPASKSRPRRWLRLGQPAVWGVTLISLTVTFAAWQRTRADILGGAHQHCDRLVESAANSIGERMAHYDLVLRAGAGLFAASQNVTREGW